MIKIATVNFGHVDVSLPLFKRFQNLKDIEFVHYFCFALNRKSESILYFTDLDVKTGFADRNTIKKILRKELTEYLDNKIDNIKFFFFYNLKLRSLYNLFLSFRLAKELKEYDIIHFNGLNGVLPILVILLRSKKLIFTIHDIIPHSGEHSKFGIVEKMINLICKSKYPVIVQNKEDFENCKKTYNKDENKFFYIPIGILDVYTSFQSKDMPSSDILFFGRISPYKGLKYLIEAIEMLKNQNIYLKTFIAGDGFLDNDLINKIKENDINCINRHLSNEELSGLLKNTKIVICPYTDATQSGVLMTAYAFDKPVIATNVGSFKEIIIDGYNGFLCEPKNSFDLALNIKNALNILDKIQYNIQCFKSYSSEYSYDNISSKMMDLYKYYFEK